MSSLSSSSSFDNLLEKIYRNINESPAAYSSLERVYQEAKRRNGNIKRSDVKKWLSNQDSFTSHRQRRKHFLRGKIITSGIDDIHQADLLDVTRLARFNSNVRYILTVIDCFSRYAMVSPLKRKTGSEVAAAFKTVYTRVNRWPKRISTDLGKEFLATEVQIFFKRNNIHWFAAVGVKKNSIIERFNRTFRRLLMTSLYGKTRPRYLPFINDIVTVYNRRKHRSIGMPPEDVTKKNESELWRKQYMNVLSKGGGSNFKFRLGDIVNILLKKNIFRKESDPTWSTRKFVVVHRRSTYPPVYLIKPLKGRSASDIDQRNFYGNELQLVNS